MCDALAHRCLNAVREHAALVLQYGRDPLRTGSPLFCDGLAMRTLEPARWRSQGADWVLSNLASQQQLFRLLEALSQVTGDATYVEAAKGAVGFALEHCHVDGLLSWGGHMAWDLRTDRPVAASNKGAMHELKRHYPHYALMFEVDPVRTQRQIEAFWQCHIRDWSNLEFSRHGQPQPLLRPGAVWEHPYEELPVFFVGQGLTFCNAGSDLYWAASLLGRLTGSAAPQVWAQRLLRRYDQTRHPSTGLGGYQFSLSILQPGEGNHIRGRGDRAREQLGPLLPDYDPTEANVVTPKRLRTILGETVIARLLLAEALGAEGTPFLQSAQQDLLAWGRQALDPETGQWHPMLTMGLRLTGLMLRQDGYYGRAGDTLQPGKSDSMLLLSYALGFRLTGDCALWTVLEVLFRALKLGALGRTPGEPMSLRMNTGSSDPLTLLALLELFRATGVGELRVLACAVGENILQVRRRQGLFVANVQSLHVRLDRLEPLALLHLSEVLQEKEGRLSPFSPGSPHFEAWHDAVGETDDEKFLYGRLDESLGSVSRQPLQAGVAG